MIIEGSEGDFFINLSLTFLHSDSKVSAIIEMMEWMINE